MEIVLVVELCQLEPLLYSEMQIRANQHIMHGSGLPSADRNEGAAELQLAPVMENNNNYKSYKCTFL
jgi:hypothetical protein